MQRESYLQQLPVHVQYRFWRRPVVRPSTTDPTEPRTFRAPISRVAMVLNGVYRPPSLTTPHASGRVALRRQAFHPDAARMDQNTTFNARRSPPPLPPSRRNEACMTCSGMRWDGRDDTRSQPRSVVGFPADPRPLRVRTCTDRPDQTRRSARTAWMLCPRSSICRVLLLLVSFGSSATGGEHGQDEAWRVPYRVAFRDDPLSDEKQFTPPLSRWMEGRTRPQR